MSLTGGPNSPFERRRASTVTLLDAELDRVHAPVIAASVSASRRASDRMARMQLAEDSRGMAIETPECEYAGEPFEQIIPVAYKPPPADAEVELRLCFRPFRRYRMGTGILCQAGEALGNTFRGHEDFQMTDNIIAKTHIGHYTMWHKAVVVDDRRLYLAEDMFCSGYVGGEGHKSVDITTVLAQKDDFLEDPIQWMEQSDGGNGASIITIDVSFPKKPL